MSDWTRDFHDAYRDALPGDDISADSMATALEKSRSCPFCGGNAWATIYHMHYRGIVVDEIADGLSTKLVVRRTVAYCVCAGGRKKVILHQKGTPDPQNPRAYISRPCLEVFNKVKDLAEILAGKYPEWQLSDPTPRPDAAAYERMPRRIREAIERIKNREWSEQ